MSTFLYGWQTIKFDSLELVHVAADGDSLTLHEDDSFSEGQAQKRWPTFGEWVFDLIQSAFEPAVLMQDILPDAASLRNGQDAPPIGKKETQGQTVREGDPPMTEQPFVSLPPSASSPSSSSPLSSALPRSPSSPSSSTSLPSPSSSSPSPSSPPVPLPYARTLPDHPPSPAMEPLKALATPKVLIYHTHNRESWLTVTRPKGREDAMDDKTNITSVGEIMADVLERAGVPVIHDDTDIFALLQHKNQPYSASYEVSREVVQTIMQKTPRIQYLFDIHRDANPRNVTTAQINSTSYAKIMFVIGESNPHWQENMTLAEELTQRLEARYPGITRPILRLSKTSWRNGEYNQSLSGDALTVEIGGHENTPEEAKRSASILAEIIAETYLEAVPVFQPEGRRES